MSVSLLNVYNDKPPLCYVCKGAITTGPVVELLWSEVFVLDESWAEEEDSYPGNFATSMDYSESELAHVECIMRVRRT